MKKLINLDEKLITAIQEFANKNYEGNFSMAMRNLVKSGLSQCDIGKSGKTYSSDKPLTAEEWADLVNGENK